MGVHPVSYVLLPHQGSFQEAGVVHAAYALNAPVHYAFVWWGNIDRSPRPSRFHPISSWNRWKQAEDGKGVIVRLYECHNRERRAHVKFSKPIKSGEAMQSRREERRRSADRQRWNHVRVPPVRNLDFQGHHVIAATMRCAAQTLVDIGQFGCPLSGLGCLGASPIRYAESARDEHHQTHGGNLRDLQRYQDSGSVVEVLHEEGNGDGDRDLQIPDCLQETGQVYFECWTPFEGKWNTTSSIRQA